jgi:hypothetical protein
MPINWYTKSGLREVHDIVLAHIGSLKLQPKEIQSRELSLAVTNLEQGCLWLNKALDQLEVEEEQ